LDRPSQFDLPTQARWLSGAFAVIHPSGSRCGAAVRVRLQLRFKKTAKAQVAQPRSNVVACVQAPAPRAVEADPATNASSTQSTPTPPLASMTLTLESVRHVFLPPKFDESESVYLSLTTTLDGDIVHNTAPMLLSGKIDCEDVVSLPSRTIGFSNITVILSAQNESNTKAAVLGSSEVDLSMLSLMKCISGWYGILDSSGNCVAYVKLRIDSKTTSAAAAFSRQETAVPSDDSLIERSSSIAPSTHNQTMTTGAPVSEFSHFFVQDSAPSTQPIDVEVDEYSAPSLEELRSKMKELDSVSLRLKKMLHDDDWQGLDPGNDCRALAENCDASNDISSTCVADNTAPQALIAYAGVCCSAVIVNVLFSRPFSDSLVARDFEIGRPQHRQHAVDCGLQSRESGSHGEFAQSSIEVFPFPGWPCSFLTTKHSVFSVFICICSRISRMICLLSPCSIFNSSLNPISVFLCKVIQKKTITSSRCTNIARQQVRNVSAIVKQLIRFTPRNRRTLERAPDIRTAPVTATSTTVSVHFYVEMC
jgi:hypothetical protein